MNRLTITIEFHTERDLQVALRKIRIGDYPIPATPGDGPEVTFKDREIGGAERIRYMIKSDRTEMES
jgi:hypothetical protein